MFRIMYYFFKSVSMLIILIITIFIIIKLSPYAKSLIKSIFSFLKTFSYEIETFFYNLVH